VFEVGELDLISCVICGKAFVGAKGGSPFCPSCQDEGMRLYLLLRAMLRDFPSIKLSVRDAAEILDVPEEVVKALFVWDYPPLAAQGRDVCPMCGDPSPLGWLCDKCKAYVRHRMVMEDH